jgi:hypothetical protein
MKTLLVFLTFTFASALATDRVEHANFHYQAIGQVPAVGIAPGMIQGLAGIGRTVPGVPCEVCFGTPDGTYTIPRPMQVYQPGQNVTYFYNVETTNLSGTANVTIDLKQSGVTVQSITGQVGIIPYSSGFIDFTGRIPSVSGYVTVVFTTTLNNVTVQGTAYMLVH